MGQRVVLVSDGHRVEGCGPDGELVNRFLAHLGSRAFSPATVRAYAYDLLNFLRFLAGRDARLADVVATDLFDYLAWQQRPVSTAGQAVVRLGAGRGAAPATMNRRIAELADFQRGVSRPGRLSLAGTMLQDSTEPELLARYRARVVAPRRSRIRAIFHRARQLGLIDPDADLEVAVTLCTGSWYARALAGSPPPANWAARTAALVWRAVGGVLPEAEETNPSQHDGGHQQGPSNDANRPS